MPKRHYDRTASKPRTNKGVIKQYAGFCLREDIAQRLESITEPWLLAIKLFKEETGIEISVQTAKNQIGKWISINGELYKLKQKILFQESKVFKIYYFFLFIF